MSCAASVVVTTPTDGDEAGRLADVLANTAIDRLHQLEQRWSRFRATSEISGLNAAGGEPRRVSADTLRLVEAMVRAWYATAGAFDPTLLGALVELGYAASRDDSTLRTSLPGTVDRRGRPAEVLVDPDAMVVQLPPGTVLDPGGIGKGLAADLVAGELLAGGAAGALVEIGGDLRVAGTPPDGRAWPISIAPLSVPAAPVVEVADGGVATSTSRLRTWTRDGRRHHHLLDPATLRPADGAAIACTVIAGSAAWAEAFTKVAFGLGTESALDRFEHHRLAASITTDDGREHSTSTWKEFRR